MELIEIAKSLKNLVSESAIKKEVATWEIEDCKNYLDKHKDCEDNLDKHKGDNVKKGNIIMKKKLKIVEDRKKLLETIVSAQEKKRKERAGLLAGMPFDLLIKYAPSEAQDPNGKKLKNHQKHTGVYLWSLGYDPKEFVGAGCSAVVWKCEDGKAMRVACDNKLLGFIKMNDSASEIKDSNEIEEILKKDPKSSKYLFSTKHIKDSQTNSKSVFETELAKHGDLQKFQEKFQGDTYYKKNI